MKKFFMTAMALMVSVAFIACDKQSSDESGDATSTIDSLENVAAETVADLEAAAKAKVAELGEGLFGTYTATLPAADASAIEATLVVNADLTFTLEQTFVGKDDVPTVTGKITDANVIDRTITLEEADGSVMMFKLIEGGNLLFLNSDGTEPADVAAYTFTRK